MFEFQSPQINGQDLQDEQDGRTNPVYRAKPCPETLLRVLGEIDIDVQDEQDKRSNPVNSVNRVYPCARVFADSDGCTGWTGWKNTTARIHPAYPVNPCSEMLLQALGAIDIDGKDEQDGRANPVYRVNPCSRLSLRVLGAIDMDAQDEQDGDTKSRYSSCISCTSMFRDFAASTRWD